MTDDGGNDRLERARAVGAQARRKLEGPTLTVLQTLPQPRPELGGQVDAILRRRAAPALRGLHQGPWHLLRARLEASSWLAAEAVFHVFPSLRDAEAYWEAAIGRPLVPRLVLPQR